MRVDAAPPHVIAAAHRAISEPLTAPLSSQPQSLCAAMDIQSGGGSRPEEASHEGAGHGGAEGSGESACWHKRARHATYAGFDNRAGIIVVHRGLTSCVQILHDCLTSICLCCFVHVKHPHMIMSLIPVKHQVWLLQVASIKPDNFEPKIISQTDDYLYAEFQSPTFGFIDDVRWSFSV